MTNRPQGRTAVYRFYDSSNRLLYVGITVSPHLRFAGHASSKEQWEQVWIREIEWFATREEAEREEARLIANEAPLWNKNGGIDRQKTKRANALSWKPTPEFRRLISRHKRAERTLNEARADLERAIVAVMRSGVAPRHIAPHVPWSDQMMYAMGKRDGMPKIGNVTTISERELAMRRAKTTAADVPPSG